MMQAIGITRINDWVRTRSASFDGLAVTVEADESGSPRRFLFGLKPDMFGNPTTDLVVSPTAAKALIGFLQELVK